MGQALRRATGRIGSSRVDTSTTSQLGKPIERRSPAPPALVGVPVEKLPNNDAAAGSVSAVVLICGILLSSGLGIVICTSMLDCETKVCLAVSLWLYKFGSPAVVQFRGASVVNAENVLEDRDLQYDAMLSQMVGRIRSKPGGKLEMAACSPGTLNVAQVRQIILLHQGKSDDHDGPMDVPQIAERFRIDASQVQNILKFVALPPEDDSKRKNNQE
ncbi:UNVERIFIED_CONTAM: hypothetical protein Slati_2786400 [Sesamum latifolium]|uniref:Uncharacterized protein n=1 Tax=Sesamum latifolium TaxID=2727402 RepID=A0AAW2W1B4_9LAMI